MDRVRVVRLIGEIASYNVNITYRVYGEKLIVRQPGGLTDEQRALIVEHKADLIAYLTTPPAIASECYRGHPVKWEVSEHGTWMCACFFEPWVASPPAPANAQPTPARASLKYAWYR